MFDLDQFIADCVTARAEVDAIRAVKEVLDGALSKSGAIAEALPAAIAEFDAASFRLALHRDTMPVGGTLRPLT